MTQEVSDDVKAWKKRVKSKAVKFFLIKANVTTYTDTTKRDENGVCIPQPGFSFYVMFEEKSTGYAKYVHFDDGMYCRYGMGTMAILKGPSILDLWQSGPGAVTEADVEIMMELYKTGTIPYPEFNLDILKDLVH